MNETSLRGHYAGFVTRLLAFLLDAAILFIVGSVTVLISTYLLSLVGFDVSQCATHVTTNTIYGWLCAFSLFIAPFLGGVFAVAYVLIFWTLAGQTPGKAIMGVRIVRLDGQHMSLWNSIRRLIGYAISLAVLGVGFLWMLADDQRQGWHDKLAQTCVVYSWDARYTDNNLLRRMFGRA
jgi:uncharacterized RDD family membrane protein YckC